MNRRPIWSGIVSAWVTGLFAVFIYITPARAQSGMSMSSGIPLGPGSVDDNFNTVKDSAVKPEAHVLTADHAPGEVQGVVRYPSGLAMAGAELVILDADVDVNQTTVSDKDGKYVFKDLKPGKYQLTAKMDDFVSSRVLTVDVIPGKSVNFDVSLASRQAILASAPLSARVSTYHAEPVSLRLDAAQPAPEPAGNEPAPTAAATKSPSSTPAAETAPSQPVPAAVAEEMDEMRKRYDALEARFEALETEMIARGTAEQPAPAAAPATAAAPKPADAAPAIPEALQAPEPGPAVDNFTPFAYADFGWMNGTSRATAPVFDTKFFTPEIRFDSYFTDDFNHPIDHTMGGSSEEFRSGEFQLEQASVGGDFHWHDARGRIILMNGMFAATTARNDASAGLGGWDIDSAYRYVSEAYGGYHFDVNHGLNVDAGIFVSYIGLFSYYNFDNWAYQPSYVSSNTPWFFNGLRIQWFPTNKLKIEPWIINGWQSYNKYNARVGLGGQILWRPKEWLGFVFNNYGMGQDNLFMPAWTRIHTDDSFLVRYYNKPDHVGLSKMAMSFTGDLGCQYGNGVTCTHNGPSGPKDSFAGWMAYNRFWFDKDQWAVTLGAGRMDNPGRYLTLLPPINQATAVTGSPYFTENPGNPAKMYDSTITVQWMPRTWATWWLEGSFRHSSVPYWTGHEGITPPGGVNGSPADYVCTNGSVNFADTYFTPSGSGFESDNGGAQNTGGPVDKSCSQQAQANPGIGSGSGWYAWEPDLRKDQGLIGAGIMIKF